MHRNSTQTMTTIFDEIKERVDLATVATRYTQLEHTGRNGRARGLCPLHSERTPSFFVFADTQRWHCFGCNQGGDVFDLVQHMEHLTPAETLRELAREAGVELAPLTPEQRAAHEEACTREAIFGVAVAHWQQAIHQPNSPGMAYAQGRGWTVDTIEYAGLGYHHDAGALRAALTRAGVNLEDAAAKAVLQTPTASLIYPHFQRGRVVYYAARGIADKRHWNPPQELVGARQPYYNHHYTSTAPTVIIVEGQGDGVSLGQLDMPAVALAGTAVDPDLIKTLRERHKQLYLGVENNDAGRTASRKLATHAGALARLVTWGGAESKRGYDANDWLVEFGDTITLHAKLHDAPTWLDILIQDAIAAPPEDAGDAIRRVLGALVHLDQFALTRLTDDICTRLDLNRSTFTTLLKMARLEAGLDQNGRPLYEVIGGQMCLRSYSRYGDETISPLLNATARIVADIVSDDGQTQQRLLEIDGALADGSKLPRAKVSADDFAKMIWVLPQWGARVIMTAGNGTAQHLRAAIQTLSTEIETRHEYTHLGWREIDGQPCYLTANGALGREGIIVQPPSDLQRYALPALDADKLPTALRASFRFLDVGDNTITLPLYAAMFLAPLASYVAPAFSVWLFGTTGSMKSTVTALAMSHYGVFSYNLPSPASWTSTTAYALRVKAFLCKDAPLWIDDYAKQSTTAGENELRKLAETLLREFGNRTGRSAGNVDGSLKTSHDPRGLVISTAEQLPPNPSIHPRLFAVEIHPGDITHGQDSALTHAQQHDAALYPMAMAGYITWLAGQLEGITERLKARREELAARATQSLQHLRSPMNVATLYIGWEMAITYLHSQDVVDDTQRDEWLQYGWEILVEVGAAQDADINREEDPIRLYFEALDNMLMQGTVYMRHRYQHDDASQDRPTLATRQTNAAFIGWYDDHYWYLLDKPAYNAVMQFFHNGSMVFPDSARGIKIKLLERGMLHPDISESYRHKVKIENDFVWVHRITRNE